MLANPFGLGRVGGKKGKSFEPLVACSEKLVPLLERFGASRKADEFFAMDEGVTGIAGQSAERQGSAAIVAVANRFDVVRRHGWTEGDSFSPEVEAEWTRQP